MKPIRKITVVTVTYGSRFTYISKLIDAVLQDAHTEKLIIVSNGSNDIVQIQEAAQSSNGKIEIIFLPQNVGSAKAYTQGLMYARGVACDFILLLDDDNVPEDNFGNIYLQNLDTFTNPGDKEKIILLGNRNKLSGNQNFFTNPPLKDHSYNATFFSVFSFQKIKKFLSIIIGSTHREKTRLFFPITPAETFAYGGTLLPISAVQEAEFPDERLILYGDDMVYSWNMKNIGYKIYVCSRPYIDDLEISLEADHHFLAYFLEKTAEFKVFFKLRNSAYLSIAYNPNKKLWVILNTYLWVFGLFIVALVKLPWNQIMWSRMKLIMKAVRLGLKKDFTIPKDLQIPPSISLSV